jgi:hypothetical protein
MKLSILWMPALMVGLFLTSACNEIENLNLTDVSAPIESEFVVNAADSIFQKDELLDPSTNSDFIDNRSKIDNIEIYRLEYQLKSINPAAADSLIEGKIEFLNPVTNAYEMLASLNNKKLRLNISEELAYEPAVADKMINVFKGSTPRATIRLKGSTNKKPIDCTIALKLYLKLKVKL